MVLVGDRENQVSRVKQKRFVVFIFALDQSTISYLSHILLKTVFFLALACLLRSISFRHMSLITNHHSTSPDLLPITDTFFFFCSQVINCLAALVGGLGDDITKRLSREPRR